jgi:hypothetical protein
MQAAQGQGQQEIHIKEVASGDLACTQAELQV